MIGVSDLKRGQFVRISDSTSIFNKQLGIINDIHDSCVDVYVIDMNIMLNLSVNLIEKP